MLKTLNHPIGNGSFTVEVAELENEFSAMTARTINHKQNAVKMVIGDESADIPKNTVSGP